MKNTENNSQRRNKKIIVCTTFREFNGNSNDQIQRLFLETLKKQTYQNYIVAATTFGEKNVEKVLKEMEIPHITFSGNAGEYRFSSTQVIENGISLINKPESYTLIWTTCDDLLEEDFFERLANDMTPLSCCTSLPHVAYKDVEGYRKKIILNYTYGGIDLLCFDGDVFLNPEVKSIIREFPNQGWGLFEFFLSGIGRLYCKRMYNMWPTKIERINNDRKANNETRSYFEMTSAFNKKTFDAFIKKYSIKGDTYRSILCYKTSIKYPKIKFEIFWTITMHRLQNFFIKGWMFKLIPRNIKDFLKKMLGKDINDRA